MLFSNGWDVSFTSPPSEKYIAWGSARLDGLPYSKLQAPPTDNIFWPKPEEKINTPQQAAGYFDNSSILRDTAASGARPVQSIQKRRQFAYAQLTAAK